jgi:hypothetical protein
MHCRYHGITQQKQRISRQGTRSSWGGFEIRPWNQPKKIDMRIWLTKVKHKASSRKTKEGGGKGGTLPKERYVASTLSGSSQHRRSLSVLSLLGALASMLTMMTGASSRFFLSPLLSASPALPLFNIRFPPLFPSLDSLSSRHSPIIVSDSSSFSSTLHLPVPLPSLTSTPIFA